MPPTSPPRGATPGACASSTSRPTTASARSLGSTPRARRPSKRRSAVLDLRLIREQPEAVERALVGKGGAELVKQVVDLDAERRRAIREAEELKALRNKLSEQIAKGKREGADVSGQVEHSRSFADRIKALDAELKQVEARIEALLVQIPNLPHPSVPTGRGEDDNVEVRHWSEPRTFGFQPKPHEEGGAPLGPDRERAAKMAKARFAVLWGGMARLERAVAQFMLDLHTREPGYTGPWGTPPVNGAPRAKNSPPPKVEEQPFQHG